MKITKKSIPGIVIVIWLIFSIGYICYDVWTDFQFNQMAQAYQQGKLDTINSLIDQAQQCNAIPVNNGTETVSVVNIDCLQAQTPVEE